MGALIDYSHFEDYAPKKKRKLFPILVFIIFLLLISFVGKNLFGQKTTLSGVVSPLAKQLIDKGIAIFNPDKNSEKLEKIVQNELKNTKGNYAVVIKNLTTGERYYYYEHKIFETASLYKLFVMGTVYQSIHNGELTQKDVLSAEIQALNTRFGIATESAELREGSLTIPVESALERMISNSDNYSALLLTNKIRLSKVALFLTQNSLIDTKMGTTGGNPTTSAYDIGLFFQKLYDGELSDNAFKENMLMLLKKQRLNSKIPKYLPKNIPIAHKTGELNKISHDAGIVFSQKNDYVIVVLTDTTNPVAASEIISTMSKSVYEYFQKKQI